MSVTVLLGNSLSTKITVKTTPSMTLAQVLQESCRQNHLDPDMHALFLNGKEMDLSLTVRLAGVLAGQKLNLKRKEVGAQNVSVAVQLPTGERVVNTYPTEQTLWEIIRHCEKEKNVNLLELYGHQTLEKKSFFSKQQEGPFGYFQLACLCLNKEISTNAELQATTLKHLGLTSGNALLRLSHKFVPESVSPSGEKHNKDVMDTINNDSINMQTVNDDSIIQPLEPTVVVHNQGAADKSGASDDLNNNNNHGQVSQQISRDLQIVTPDSKHSTIEDYPDDFYELSVEDYKTLAKQQEQKEREHQVLKTKSIREKESQTKRTKYTKTTIRVRFPDRLEIQANFSPQETASAVAQFVKENLQYAEVPFFLFLSPPLQLLDDTQTLESLGLVPTAVVHFSWKKGVSNPPTTFLKPTTLSIPSINNNADQPKEPVAIATVEPTLEEPAQEEPRQTPKVQKQVPKWFQSGKKK